MKQKTLLPLALALLMAIFPAFPTPAAAESAGEPRFAVQTERAGYYTLRLRYRPVGDRDQTMSLFLNARFAKTLRFDAPPDASRGEHVAEAPVYLPRGASEIRLRRRAGDGHVRVEALAVEPRKGETKLIVVPHEDDEVFAFGGIIQTLLQQGDDVRVALLTNGDFFGLEYGPERIVESVYALDRLGLPRGNLFVLGYPDSSLTALLDAENPSQALTFPQGATETYGNPGLPLYDYHTLQTGAPAALTGENLLGDMKCLLGALMPSEIYTTSLHDRHSDHSAAYRLVERAIRALRAENGYAPLLHESVVHGAKQSWPERLRCGEDGEPVCEPFTDPFPGGTAPLDWRKATKVRLTEEMRENKYDAIGEYYTQNEVFGGAEYDFSYYKTDEFYWTRDFSKEK